MPFYEYQCRACNAQVEVLQKITDAPLKKCPECGQNKLAKLVSAPVFRLKGGGWYETDFKGEKDVKRNLVDSDKGEAAPATADQGAEKPAGKTEEKSTAAADTKPADAKPAGTKAAGQGVAAKRAPAGAKKRAAAKGSR